MARSVDVIAGGDGDSVALSRPHPDLAVPLGHVLVHPVSRVPGEAGILGHDHGFGFRRPR
jgi:hypothetical protein